MIELYLVQCCLVSKYSINQLCTQLGMGNWDSFWISVKTYIACESMRYDRDSRNKRIQ